MATMTPQTVTPKQEEVLEINEKIATSTEELVIQAAKEQTSEPAEPSALVDQQEALDVEAQKKWESDTGISLIRTLPKSLGLFTTLVKHLAKSLRNIAVFLFIVIPSQIVVTLVLIFAIAAPFAWMSAMCAYSMAGGNAILTHKNVFVAANGPAAMVGAVGGVILALCIGLGFVVGPSIEGMTPSFLRKQKSEDSLLTSSKPKSRCSLCRVILIQTLMSTLAGVIGRAAFMLTNVDLKGLDMQQTTYDGLVGGLLYSAAMAIFTKLRQVRMSRKRARMESGIQL